MESADHAGPARGEARGSSVGNIVVRRAVKRPWRAGGLEHYRYAGGYRRRPPPAWETNDFLKENQGFRGCRLSLAARGLRQGPSSVLGGPRSSFWASGGLPGLILDSPGGPFGALGSDFRVARGHSEFEFSASAVRNVFRITQS